MKTVAVSTSRSFSDSMVAKVFMSAMVALVTLAFVGMSLLAFTPGGKSASTSAEDGDWTRWFMCEVFPEPMADVYQFTTTDDLAFEFRSKSIASDGAQKIDSFYNKLLQIGTDDDFSKTNEDILGRGVSAKAEENANGEELTEEEKKAKEEEKKATEEARKELTKGDNEVTSASNGGVAVNPYQRFGVSGLFFTDYMGEWKYLVVNACAPDSEPKDPKSGLMYEERLAPQATWENRSNSTDIRVVQSTRPTSVHFFTNFMNAGANLAFSVTKFIVVLALGIIFFSFSDVPEVLGINDVIGGSNGVFSSLSDGIFAPLLWIALLATAIKMFWVTAVQRRMREGTTMMLTSLFLALLGFIAAVIPTKFISFPNDVATVGQSLIISSVGGSIKYGEGLCSPQEGDTKITDAAAATSDKSILEQANTNIRASIGCQYWENFLMRPWSEGQFGDNYSKLWAKGFINNTGAGADGAEEIAYDNDKIVGKASVPMGGGTFMHNWAVFQLSTQTDVHAQINGEPGTISHYTTGIASDAWRVVDMLSNYDEESKVDVVYESERGGKSTIEYKAQKESNEPSEYWSTWVGNNNLGRTGVALGSILIALVGVAVPLMFACMSAMLSVAIAVMMSFAPFMFLMGAWSIKGRQIFFSWVSLVLNAVFKRIAIGFLLVVTLIGQSELMSMTSSISYWAVLFATAMFSFIMWKAKDRIIAVFASFNFGSMNLQNSADETSGRVKQKVDATKNMTASLAGATIGNKRAGGTLKGGLYDGLKYEVKNIAYRNNILSQAKTQYDITKYQSGELDLDKKAEYCIACGKRLEYDKRGRFSGGILGAGELLCEKCFKEQVHPDATVMRFTKKRAATMRDGWDVRTQRARNERLRNIQQSHHNAFGGNSSTGGESSAVPYIKQLGQGHRQTDDKGNKFSIPHNPAERQQLITNIVDALKVDMIDFNQSMADFEAGDGTMPVPPKLPPQFASIIDEKALGQAYSEGNTEYVSNMYAAALGAYVKDVSNGDTEIDIDEVASELNDAMKSAE